MCAVASAHHQLPAFSLFLPLPPALFHPLPLAATAGMAALGKDMIAMALGAVAIFFFCIALGLPRQCPLPLFVVLLPLLPCAVPLAHLTSLPSLLPSPLSLQSGSS